MIECVIGLPGSGKTLITTHWAITNANRYNIVACNYYIELPDGRKAYQMRDLQDMIYISEYAYSKRKRVLMIIDEANIWFASRFWNRIPPQMLYLWSQTRKFSIDLIYTTQSFKRVDTALREITNYVYKVRLHSILPRWWRSFSSWAVSAPVGIFNKELARKLKRDVKQGQLFAYLATVEQYLPYDIDTRDGLTTDFDYLRKWHYLITSKTWGAYSTYEKIYIPSVFFKQAEVSDQDTRPFEVPAGKPFYDGGKNSSEFSQKTIKLLERLADK